MPEMTWVQRALQLWPLLVSGAKHRQTFTYEFVSKLVGVAPEGLAYPLGILMRYCRHKELPPITVLVVNSATGQPGEGLPLKDLNRDRERVFNYPWLEMQAPTTDELEPFSKKEGAGHAHA